MSPPVPGGGDDEKNDAAAEISAPAFAAAAAAAPVALRSAAEISAAPYDYALAGVLVHTGSANGGHYYSYIRDRTPTAAGGAENRHCFFYTRLLKYVRGLSKFRVLVITIPTFAIARPMRPGVWESTCFFIPAS